MAGAWEGTRPGDSQARQRSGLAGGGGQQSAAFAVLGANVTVFDLSDEMLARDRTAVAHYGLDVTTIQGDVRDTSALAADGFDVVWQAHSLSFIPEMAYPYQTTKRYSFRPSCTRSSAT